jgi:hypothetical protein
MTADSLTEVEVGMADIVKDLWVSCLEEEKKCVVGIGKKKTDCGVFCAERLFSATSLLDPRAGLSLRPAKQET